MVSAASGGSQAADTSAASSAEQDAHAGASDAPTPSTAPTSTRTLVLGLLATAAVLGLAAVLAVTGLGDEPVAEPPVADRPAGLDAAVETDVGDGLHDVVLDGFVDGQEVALASYAGTPFVLNFWATWCPPCVEEMPDLQEVAELFEGRLAMLGVSYLDDLAQATELVADLAITYDLAVDEGGALFDEVGGMGMPTTLLVDADGAIVLRHTGPVDVDGLVDLIATHLDVHLDAPG